MHREVAGLRKILSVKQLSSHTCLQPSISIQPFRRDSNHTHWGKKHIIQKQLKQASITKCCNEQRKEEVAIGLENIVKQVVSHLVQYSSLISTEVLFLKDTKTHLTETYI